MPRLYFARHGESEANLLREISNRGYKHPLTGRGRAQAGELAQRLQSCAITRIYTSPVMRALQTAELVGAALGLPLKVTPALREFDCGIAEGKSDEASWALHEQVWRDWSERGAWERRIEGGESLLDIRARFVPFVQRLLETYPASSEHILLLGHAGLYLSVLPTVCVNVNFAWAVERGMDYACVVIAEPGPDGLRCVEWGGVACE